MNEHKSTHTMIAEVATTTMTSLCVRNICTDEKLLSVFCDSTSNHTQGGAEHSGNCTQRSYPLVLEAESDQLCVPAEPFSYGKGLSQEPQQHLHVYTVAAI